MCKWIRVHVRSMDIRVHVQSGFGGMFTHTRTIIGSFPCVYLQQTPNCSTCLDQHSSSTPRVSAETFLEFHDRANTSVQNISVDGCRPNPNQKSHKINILLLLYLTPASHVDLEGSYWPAPSVKNSPNCTAPLYFL